MAKGEPNEIGLGFAFVSQLYYYRRQLPAPADFSSPWESASSDPVDVESGSGLAMDHFSKAHTYAHAAQR